ncbi:MAG: hypothetical protein QOE77_3071 [Blastocatellia bacterium]|jgi:hypothetical protein|nr:hypothetical protein [Blastocatellia bacterium]
MKKKLGKDPLGVFRELGILVESRWRAQNYDDALFPEIAAEALAEVSPATRVDAWEIVTAFTSEYALPAQQDIEGSFGNPPITVFSGNRFYIDVYFWLDGTTAKHQHAFAGAFQVLLGSSLHSHYTYADEKRINPQFSIGRLKLNEVQLLSVGDIKQIIPGRSYIHSLFHLDRPSATITVRTVSLPNFQPQFNYLPPGIAFDPFFRESGLIKKRQIANLLLGMQHARADEMIADILSSSDLHTDFMVLEVVYQNLQSGLQKFLGISHNAERFEKTLALVRRKHGPLVDSFRPAFIENDRINDLVRRRNYVHSAEHRFFFALLMNVTGRKRILDLVRQRFPDQEPEETIVDWVDELAQTKKFASNEPNALGIEEFGDEHLMVFEALVKNRTLRQTQKEMRAIFKGMKSQEADSRTSSLYEALRNVEIFKPLFAQD